MPLGRAPDRKMDVLFVADDDTQAERLRREVGQIEAFDVNIELIEDVAAAIQLLEEQTFEVVVTALPLSEGSGLDVLRDLSDYLGNLPVVAMTDEGDFRMEHEALGLGVDEILYQHHLDPNRLVRALTRAKMRQQTSWTHRRLERAVEQAVDGLVIVDATTDDRPIVLCNRGFERLTGYPEHEVLGRNCRFLQSSKTSDETVQQIRDALEREEPIKVVIRNQRQSGEHFWNELAINPVENPEGRVTEFVGVQRDVTERVETERELARKNNELESYRTVVEHANEVIFFKDEQGRYCLGNKKAAELFEIDLKSLVGATDDELFGEEAAEALRERDERVRETGQPSLDEWTFELPGGPRTFLTSVFPDELPNGETGIVGIARDITDLEPLDQQALYDHLTGLPSRDLFRDRIRRTIESSSPPNETFAVGVVDLDDFRAVNESLGYDTGDVLLQEMTDRIQSLLHDDDTIGRLDSDRFGLFLPTIEKRSDIRELAARFEERFEQPFETADATIYLAASIGFALVQNGTPRSDQPRDHIRTLMRTANDAMRRAKESAGSSWRLLTPANTESTDNRLELEHDIREGIVHDQFEPHYQPIFAFDGGLHTIELLARWEHPQRGWIPPADFIPVAERTGLLDAITEQLVDQAYNSIWESNLPARWPDPVPLNVNLSPGQLASPDLLERIAELASGPGSDATQLVIEVVEGQLLERAAQIQALSEHGFRIVVDDFGTGYSSLTRLKELPLDELKLDMEFVQGAVENDDDAAILRTVAELGRQLEVPVVGEGVETAEQLELLREIGCDAAQGYYLGRPAPFDEFLQHREEGSDLASGRGDR